MAVGVFRNSATSAISTHYCGSSNQTKNPSTEPPSPDDLLGVLHVPLHCVHITEQQHEVKLRLPVTIPSPTSNEDDAFNVEICAKGERELAAVLSPVTSLDLLEKAFIAGLTFNTTGANRCNVMLFRLNSSGGSSLHASGAKLASPVAPSVASTALQRSITPLQYQESEVSKQSIHGVEYSGGEGETLGTGTALGNEAASAAKRGQAHNSCALQPCDDDSPPSPGMASHNSDVLQLKSERRDTQHLSPPSCGQRCTTNFTKSTDSVASNLQSKDGQWRRHQRRQQELSVAAVLAASAIAAAARGERDRSSRSSVSRKLQQPQKLLSGLSMKNNQRPSSTCGVMTANQTSRQQNDCFLSGQPHELGLVQISDLQHRRDSPSTAVTDRQLAQQTGEFEVSPDDSVSVRGEENHKAGAATANHVAASCLLVNRPAVVDCAARLGSSILDDRKSTLSTSIRRLDCLMTRAQLLLNQRRHRQSQEESHQQTHSNYQSFLHRQTDHAQSIPSFRGDTFEPELQKEYCKALHFRAAGDNSLCAVPTKEVERPDPTTHRAHSEKPADSKSPSSGSSMQIIQNPHDLRKVPSRAKVFKWLAAASASREKTLTRK